MDPILGTGQLQILFNLFPLNPDLRSKKENPTWFEPMPIRMTVQKLVLQAKIMEISLIASVANKKSVLTARSRFSFMGGQTALNYVKGSAD
jgi:hypothetical protein